MRAKPTFVAILLIALALSLATVCRKAKQPARAAATPQEPQWTGQFAADLSNAEYPPGVWTIADDFAEEWAKQPATWHYDAIFGYPAPPKSGVKPAGEWNHYRITCAGKRITVEFNG